MIKSYCPVCGLVVVIHPRLQFVLVCDSCLGRRKAHLREKDRLSRLTGGTSCPDDYLSQISHGGSLPFDEAVKMQRGVSRNGQVIRKPIVDEEANYYEDLPEIIE